MTTITARQTDVLRLLWTFQRAHGYQPSLRELGHALGIGSTAMIQQHLVALERKGYIRRIGPRALELLRGPGEVEPR